MIAFMKIQDRIKTRDEVLNEFSGVYDARFCNGKDPVANKSLISIMG